jgi:hypothetical protein
VGYLKQEIEKDWFEFRGQRKLQLRIMR